MRTQFIDDIVNEILTDMSNRQKTAPDHMGTSSIPEFEEAFGAMIPENDETSNVIMRRIWKELQETH